MSLISQPGSDYQLTEITLDLGRARDITHCSPTSTACSASYASTSTMSSPRSPRWSRTSCATATALAPADTLVGALEVITQLTRAIRDAVLHISPTASQPGPLPF
jgi:hypothetical protein